MAHGPHLLDGVDMPDGPLPLCSLATVATTLAHCSHPPWLLSRLQKQELRRAVREEEEGIIRGHRTWLRESDLL